MFGQAPGLGENLARIRSLHSGKINNSARQPSGKVSSSRRGGKCLDRRRDLVKIPHVHRQPSGKVNNSARQPSDPSGKVSSSRRGWKMFGSVAGPGENSTRTPPAFGKSQQLCSWAKMAADNLGAGCGRAVPGPARPLPRQGPAPRAAHMRSEDCTSTSPVLCLFQDISWLLGGGLRHFLLHLRPRTPGRAVRGAVYRRLGRLMVRLRTLA